MTEPTAAIALYSRGVPTLLGLVSFTTVVAAYTITALGVGVLVGLPSFVLSTRCLVAPRLLALPRSTRSRALMLAAVAATYFCSQWQLQVLQQLPGAGGKQVNAILEEEAIVG